MEESKMENAMDQEPVFDEQHYRKKLKLSFTLLLVFTVTYFLAAIITTRELKDIAVLEIMGIPLAVYLGMLVFIVGIVVTRISLVKNQ